jgi:hypothetical protein
MLNNEIKSIKLTSLGESNTCSKSDLDKDLEQGINIGNFGNESNDKGLGLNFEGNPQNLSTSTDFDMAVFNKIGFIFNKNTQQFLLNKEIYSSQFFKNYTQIDKIKLIQIYFKIELNRWGNQEIYVFTQKHQVLLHFIYIISILINMIIPYLSSYIQTLSHNSRQSIYFIGLSSIICAFNYLLTRFLMSTSANGLSFITMQQNLLKMRLCIETLIVGTHPSIATLSIDDYANNLTNLINKIIADSEFDLNTINQTQSLMSNPTIAKTFRLMTNNLSILENNLINQIITNSIILNVNYLSNDKSKYFLVRSLCCCLPAFNII